MATRSANVISDDNNGGRVSITKGVIDPLSLFLSDHSWKAEFKGRSRGHHLGVKSYFLSHGHLRRNSDTYLRADILFVPKYSMSCHDAQQLDLIFVALLNTTGTTKNFITKL